MANLRSKKLWAGSAVVAASVLLLTVALTHTGRAKPRPAATPATAPLVTCSPIDEVCREGLLTGTYTTAINIHNPNNTGITAWKQAAQALPEGNTPPSASSYLAVILGAGDAVEVDCYDIEVNSLSETFPAAFTKGFVTILSPSELDVVGVYSGQPPSVLIPNPSGGTQTQYPGLGFEMLQIPQRVLVLPNPRTGVATAFYVYSAKFLCGLAQSVS